MKNYLKITMGLVLASMIVSCSDEDNNIVPDINPDPVPPTEGTFILPAPAVESNIPEHDFLMGALFSFQKKPSEWGGCCQRRDKFYYLL